MGRRWSCFLLKKYNIMHFTSLIQFVEGSLNEQERKEVEKYIFLEPNMLDVISGMNRIKRELQGTMSLTEYFERASNRIEKGIQSKLN